VQIDHELRKLDEIWVGAAVHDSDVTDVDLVINGDEISEENGLEYKGKRLKKPD
jgi:hypothetical protein